MPSSEKDNIIHFYNPKTRDRFIPLSPDDKFYYSPADVSTMDNVPRAQELNHFEPIENLLDFHIRGPEFASLVGDRNIWDYKNRFPKGSPLWHRYERFGNLHYGFVGKHAGFTNTQLLKAAGWANTEEKGGREMAINNKWNPLNSKFDIINPFAGKKPYGDNPRDAVKVNTGIWAYKNNYQIRDVLIK